jgi:hypothetical protein
MNSLCRSAVVITGNYTKPAMRLPGEKISISNALEVAKGFWEQTHPKSALADSAHNPTRVPENLIDD